MGTSVRDSERATGGGGGGVFSGRALEVALPARSGRASVAGQYSERADGGPMSDPPSIVITIDGPAATGKTSVAHEVARRLAFDFLDTGAMYRAAALIALEHGLVRAGGPVATEHHAAIVSAVAHTSLAFDWETPGDEPPALLCNGVSVMKRIRQADVTSVVSPIAGIRPLREIMVAKQRQIAADHPRLVTEGRDQGAIVFPEAKIKFFLDADRRVRARRRRDQLVESAGTEHGVPSVDDIARDLEKRDEADTREGRLQRPKDATIVDTTNLNFEQVVAVLVEKARAVIPA